jgi:hypothetical protein
MNTLFREPQSNFRDDIIGIHGSSKSTYLLSSIPSISKLHIFISKVLCIPFLSLTSMKTSIISHNRHKAHITMSKPALIHKFRLNRVGTVLHEYRKYRINKTFDAADFMSDTSLLS